MCGIDTTLLEAEITIALNLLRNDLGDSLLASNLETFLCKLAPLVVFPNLLKRVKVALTLPVTSASCERSFSAMNLIKTYLRKKPEITDSVIWQLFLLAYTMIVQLTYQYIRRSRTT